VVRSTPEFAGMLGFKYAGFGAARVILDLKENHGRAPARPVVRDVADAVAAVAPAKGQAREVGLAPARGGGGDDHHRAGRPRPVAVRGWLARGDGRHPGVPRQGRPAAARDRHGGPPESGKPTSFDRRDREIDRVRAVDPGAW